MNLIMPVCPIPEELGWILQSHFHNNRSSYARITDEVYESPFLKLMVPKLFGRYMKGNNMESMLNALGWNGFRDRLTSMYIYKALKGNFPTELVESCIADIKKFENELIDFAPEGHSRIFMLAVYLKLCEIKFNSEHQYINDQLLVVKPVIKRILEMGTQKSVKADWLILTLMNIVEIVDEEVLINTINNHNGNFYKVLGLLKEEEKEKVMTNLLAYGASINDNDMFIYDRV